VANHINKFLHICGFWTCILLVANAQHVLAVFFK